MNILRLAAELTLNGGKFKAGLRESSSFAKNWASDFSGAMKGELAAAFGGAALVAYVKNTLQSISALKDQAEQARVTTAEFQRLGMAAEDAGLKEEDWTRAQDQFDRNRREAVESNEELRKTFLKYGTTLTDLQNPQFRFIDFLRQANQAMQNMSPEQKARASVEMFDMLGKLGPRMQGFLQSVDKFKNSSVVGDEAINSLDQADKKLAALHRRFKLMVADNVNNPWQMLVSPFSDFTGIKKLINGKKQPEPQNTNALTEEEGNELLEQRAENLKKIAEYEKQIADFQNTPGMSQITKDELSRPWQRSVNELKDRNTAIEKATGFDPLYKDKIREAKENQRLEAQLSLEKAILKVKLEQMSASEQRAAKEKMLMLQLAGIKQLELFGGDATKEREQAVNMLSELMSSGPSAPPNSSLTSVGQWGGRSFVNSNDSKLIETAKGILLEQQKSNTTLTKIEQKKGLTIQ